MFALVTSACGAIHQPQVDNLSAMEATFPHAPNLTSCASCHSTSTEYLAVQKTIANQMLHTFSGLPDCISCHGPAASASNFVSWVVETGTANAVSRAQTSLGVLHANAGSSLTSCQPCHANERPTATVGGFNHVTGGGTGDCAPCHAGTAANIGLTWQGGQVSGGTGFNHNPMPTTCVSCHSSNKPSGTVPDTATGFNHDPTYGTECASCHASVTAWKPGFFNHNNNNASSFTSCSPCHDTYHHHAGTNCANCHGITWPTSSTSGGSFN